MRGQKDGIRFNCREWEARDGGVLKITGALLGTSERHQGITLRPRWTFVGKGY